MSDLVVNVTKVAFVAALYAFLFFTARAIRGHVAEPRGGRPTEAKERIATVVITAPESSRRTIEVRRPLVLGRGSQADISLSDAFASDRHARLDTTGGRLFVQDLGSTNGTMVNGERITDRTSLERGDTIRIGGTMMEVQ